MNKIDCSIEKFRRCFLNCDYLFIFVYSLLLFTIISPDSFLYDIYHRSDDATFLTSGRALFNGLIPYVDYSDSKGLLLWFIYGIGYLIDDDSFLGVFLLSIIAVYFTFLYLYKISQLYINNRKVCLIITMLSSLALFNPNAHYFTRAETFCWPILTISIYFTLKYINDNCDNPKKFFSFIGFAFAWCFMIKFTIAIMLLICVLFFLIKSYKNKEIGTAIFYFIIGLSIIMIPCGVYFMITGNLRPFIHEYFFATTQTVVEGKSSLISLFTSYLNDLCVLIGKGPVERHRTHFNACINLVYIFGACLLFFVNYKKKEFTFWSFAPIAISIWFVLICSAHAKFQYYYEPCSLLSIFGLISVFLWSKNLTVVVKSYFVMCSVVVFLCSCVFSPLVRLRGENFSLMDKRDENFFTMEYLANKIPNPKFIYMEADKGMGMTANALPACKYWIVQNGATYEMLKDQINAIKGRRADFIVVPDEKQRTLYLPYVDIINQEGFDNYDSFVQAMGYERCNLDSTFMWHYYAKKEYSMNRYLPLKEKPTKLDVLLKKNIYRYKN